MGLAVDPLEQALAARAEAALGRIQDLLRACACGGNQEVSGIAAETMKAPGIAAKDDALLAIERAADEGAIDDERRAYIKEH